jgi:hypothetical protein
MYNYNNYNKYNNYNVVVNKYNGNVKQVQI